MTKKGPFFPELIAARVALTPDTDTADHWEPPAYGTKGWVIVEVLEVMETRQPYRFELGDYAVDDEASTFWIKEGVGMEFWLDGHAPDEFDVGWWVFEGVVGKRKKPSVVTYPVPDRLLKRIEEVEDLPRLVEEALSG